MSIWIIIVSVVLLFSALGAVYLTSQIGRFGVIRTLAGENKWKRRGLSFLIVVAGFVTMLLVFNLVNAFLILIHTVAFFLLGRFVVYIIKIIRGKDISSKKNLAGWGAILYTIVYLAAGYYLCNNVWQTDYQLSTDKSIGELKVAMFADSHIGSTFGGEGFAKQMEVIMAAEPDIVLIPGDYVDDDTSKEDMIASCAALGRMKPKYGVWFAYGNHDKGYFGSQYNEFSSDELEQELKKNGVHVMEDAVETVDNLVIVGRKDSSRNRDRKELSELLQGVDESKYIIVMDHEPNDYEKESQTTADLVVSGHTHGGQLLPVTYFGVWFGINDSIYGYEKRNQTDFIVTSGISDWQMLFKTGTKSEYVMIDVKGK